MLVLYLVAFPKIDGILALLHKEGVLCIICTVAGCHRMGYIIFTKCSVYCNSAFCQCSAICSGLVRILYCFLLCAFFCRIRSGMLMILPVG